MKKIFYQVNVRQLDNDLCRMNISVVATSIPLAEKKALAIAKTRYEADYEEKPNGLYTDSVERMGEIYI
jgi:hypothetical protein